MITRTLAVVALLFSCCLMPALGTNYYVRTDGSDSNNGLTNTTGGAWLTVNKALGSSGVPLTGGPHTLNINAGTYSESTQLSLGKSYGTLTTVQPTTGANDVVITGASGNYNVLQNGAISNLLITNITFTARSGSLYAFTFYSGNGYTISNCTLVGCVFNGGSRTALDWQDGGFSPAQAVTLNNCTMNGASTTGFNGTYIPSLADLNNITLTATNCTFTGVSGGQSAFCAFNGSVTLSNSKFFGRGSTVACQVGQDGNNNNSLVVTGTLSGNTIYSDSSHGLLLGAGATNVTASGCYVYSSNDNTVLKDATGCTINGCVLAGGSSVSLLLKGATNCVVTNCVILGKNEVIADYDGDSTYKASGNSVAGNRVISFGGALTYWQSGGDGGNNTVDFNTYSVLNGGNYGTIGSTSSLSGMTARLAAWSTYGSPSNDLHSQDVTIAGRRLLLDPLWQAWP